MKVNKAGRGLIVSFEGLKLNPYLDKKGIPTIGIGTCFYEDGTAVTMNDPSITIERAYELFDFSSQKFAEVITKFLDKNKIELTENQFGALVSFCYNLGPSAIITKGRSVSDALRKKDMKAVADVILLYNKVDGEVCAGIVRRREAERKLFLT